MIAAIIQTTVNRDGGKNVVWRTATVWAGVVIVARELAAYEIRVLVRYGKNALVDRLAVGAFNEPAAVTYLKLLYLMDLILALVIFLFSMRFILLLPILVMERLDWKTALSKSWGDMRGNYVFALVVSFAAVLPIVLADHVLGRLYRNLTMPGGLPVPMSHLQWEAVATRSAELTFDYILIAALAAGLYANSRSRVAPVTAP